MEKHKLRDAVSCAVSYDMTGAAVRNGKSHAAGLVFPSGGMALQFMSALRAALISSLCAVWSASWA